MAGPPEGLGYARRAAAWAGVTMSTDQEAVLVAFADWLSTEAIGAGGLGPAEAERIWPRHIADSLTFAVGWRDRPAPNTLLDIGSGVGLPGIPLAITHPGTAVTLLDRSARRIDLANRAIRILGLSNARTRLGNGEDEDLTYAAVTMRAVMPVSRALATVEHCLEPGGVGVLGASRTREPRADHDSTTTLPIPEGVLDSPAWLLRMTRPT